MHDNSSANLVTTKRRTQAERSATTRAKVIEAAAGPAYNDGLRILLSDRS